MKIAAISELKAKLSYYLRLVKTGEKVEIHDRGTPVAILSAKEDRSRLNTVPPRKDPAALAKRKFHVHPKRKFDAAAILEEERSRR